jgi:hypothetical protein
MHVSWLLLVVPGVLAAAPQADTPEKPRSLQILAQADDSRLAAKETIRSVDDLVNCYPQPTDPMAKEKAMAEAAKAFGVKTIDFDKQMIVGFIAGTNQPRVQLVIYDTQVGADGKSATVFWRWIYTGRLTMDDRVPRASVLLIEKLTGKVSFKEGKPKFNR